MNQTTKSVKRRPTPKKQPIQQEHLKQESSKIQSKLESLRAQIEQKKKQKQVKITEQMVSTKTSLLSQKTSHSSSQQNSTDLALQRFLKNKTNDKQNHQSQRTIYVEEVLKQLNIPEAIITVLSYKNINTIEELIGVSDEQIDGWKDIGIGYRVKLKKFIQVAQKQKQLESVRKQKNELDLNVGLKIEQLEEKQQNIEDIINRRQKNRVFVKIEGREQQQQQEEEYFQKSNTYKQKDQIIKEEKNEQTKKQEEQQDILIESLNEAFFGKKQRKSIMRDKSRSRQSSKNSSSKKQVHWSKTVKNYDRSNKKVYTEKKATFVEIQPQPQNQIEQFGSTNKKRENYCWSCLKKSSSLNPIYDDNRMFCSELCHTKYREMIKVKLEYDETREKQIQDEEIEIIDLQFL